METRLSGRTAATAATIGHVAAALWNPHATMQAEVYEIHICNTQAAVANIALKRITARGTPGTSVTAVIQNDRERETADPLGGILDLAAYTVQPTLDGAAGVGEVERWNLPAAVGSGVIFAFPKPVKVPALSGLAIITPVAVLFPSSDITFVYDS